VEASSFVSLEKHLLPLPPFPAPRTHLKVINTPALGPILHRQKFIIIFVSSFSLLRWPFIPRIFHSIIYEKIVGKSQCRQLDQAAEKYASHTWVAMARQSRGELAKAQGKLDDALSYLASALTGFRTAGNAYESARCQTATASVLLMRNASGDNEAACAAQGEAEQVLERLGSL
jgi:hypothetical protein